MKDVKHCSPCGLAFSSAMMGFHLSHHHLVLCCQVCRTPMQRLGITRDPFAQGQFCSSSCKAQAERRGLCTACSKESDGTFQGGTCARCRRTRFNVGRQIQAVNGTLGAIHRAAFLPRVYERRDRGIA